MHQPIVVAQHRPVESRGRRARRACSSYHTRRVVCDPDDKTTLEPDHVYLAPPDYHLLVEDGHFALSTDAPVQFARPSIDVLFESVADAYGERAIGIVLTGANADGAAASPGSRHCGGVAIVQDPATSERRAMPDAAIAATAPTRCCRSKRSPAFLYGLCCEVAA